MKKIICPSCEEKYNPEEGNYSELKEVEICTGCYESDSEHSSTLIRYNGQKESVKFGEYVAYGEDGDIPEWFRDVFEKREWVSTDAWRGYYQTKLKGLVKLADGWVTGYLDENTQYKKPTADLYELLESGVELPAELFWLFEPTSNVFSTACEIYVAEENQKKIIGWLKRRGYTIENLQEALG